MKNNTKLKQNFEKKQIYNFWNIFCINEFSTK